VKPRAIIELKNAGQGRGDIAPGLTLAQLKGILEAYDARVELHYADADSEDAVAVFREELRAVLADSVGFLIANFKGRAIGASSDGHISPVAAYDEKTDSVLLLDVAGHLNPWYWVPVAHRSRRRSLIRQGPLTRRSCRFFYPSARGEFQSATMTPQASRAPPAQPFLSSLSSSQ